MLVNDHTSEKIIVNTRLYCHRRQLHMGPKGEEGKGKDPQCLKFVDASVYCQGDSGVWLTHLHSAYMFNELVRDNEK